MPRQALLECSFLIPTRRDRNLSDGKAHKRQTWNWLDEELDQFGGATMAGELYEGWYVDFDTGTRVRDHSQKFIVALPRQDVEQLRSVLRDACGQFQQKCIYLSVAGRVEFVERRAHENE